jgi:ribosomal RNA methyltransferase Nop2
MMTIFNGALGIGAIMALIGFILLLAKGAKAKKFAAMLKDKKEEIAKYKEAHKNIFRDYKVTKMGVAYVTVAKRIAYNGKSFVVDQSGIAKDEKFTLQVIRQNELINEAVTDLQTLTRNQKELILQAFDSVKASGGELCYCTCSVLVEENEEVVDYLLRKRSAARCIPPPTNNEEEKKFDSALIPGLTRYEGKIFHDSVKNSRRVYPHRLNMDGFFFALIKVLPHQVDATQTPTDVEKGKPDTRTKKQRKFSKRLRGK